MVKVVSPAPTKQTTCQTCRSVLEYTFSDVAVETYRDYSGWQETVGRIVCPVCKARTNVPARF